ncbi:FAS-associated death domain protein-like [Gouania willdenowi]|uniref:FAS-associated death domain protein-like n=1 Tax=Gouania willdenowi TaxID=441366 RepID=UPI001055F157|nr:FAS-associated death domain protein-like [Gouania willdenowi]
MYKSLCAKLDVAMEIISESLGKSWRKLGRKLGVTEVKLESIAQRHPTDLEETSMELLKEWRRSKGGEAQTHQLIQALRSCHFNMTADKLEDKLSALEH